MASSKIRQVALLWALALAFSAALAAAGQRWPEPLPVRFDVVTALLLLPPLAVALWLLARWRLPSPSGGGFAVPAAGDGDGGESPEPTESVHTREETQA